jgi:hypothetical protein
VTQTAFQAALARLLVDADFRDEVRERGERALDGDLTELERRRVVAVASDAGLEITRTLHDGWRLSKALLMLPLTCALLGHERLAQELRDFWHTRTPRSLYFREEAIAFCDHLRARARSTLRLVYLEEVVGFERAALELRAPWAPDPPRQQEVEFSHDPEVLFAELAAGRRPRAIPERHCVLLGRAVEPGTPEWRLAPRA